MLGRRGKKLRPENLRLLGHDGVDGHGADRAVTLLHVRSVELNAWEGLVEGLRGCGGVGVLVLELAGARLLLHHVWRRAKMAGLQSLVAHDLRQSGSVDSVETTHHVVGHGWGLGKASLLP